MSWIDIILFIFLIIIVYICFSTGLIRVASVMLGMYLGLQVAALFYKIFANITSDGSAASTMTNQVIWFGILWLVWSIILSLVVISFTKEYSLPKTKKWGNIDQVGGLVLGIFAGVFGILVVSYVVRNTVTMAWAAAQYPHNYMEGIVYGFDGSLLMSIFRTLKVVFLNVLSPWLPSNEIPVFTDKF
ncbi:MAG: CvpA family protein [Chloroflexota bacterium]|nr:CvpA family protein [Chloroflexota bacterium]